MCLDYDGTLSQPSLIQTELSYPASFVKLAELYYAGSHGMDIKGPTKGLSRYNNDKPSVLYQPAGDSLPMIDENNLQTMSVGIYYLLHTIRTDSQHLGEQNTYLIGRATNEDAAT
ncbi:hypothetical protein YC2023_107840 [Brassica napus]